MMSRNSGNAKHAWITCRERRVNTCSSRVSAALPQIPRAPTHHEEDIIREIHVYLHAITLQPLQALLIFEMKILPLTTLLHQLPHLRHHEST